MSGGSANTYDATIAEVLKLIGPKTVLEIGPGQGKYAQLIKNAGLSPRTIALEIEPTYVDAFGLREKYDEVRVLDAGELPYLKNARNELFDCVIIGDCIEHIPKSRGIDLLNFLNYRCGWIIIVAPEFSYYDTGDMAHTESHISCWSEFDFQWHDRFAYMRAEIMQLFLLRGYQPSPISFEHLVGRFNADPPRVVSLGGKAFKPAHLEAFMRSRVEAVEGNIYGYRQL